MAILITLGSWVANLRPRGPCVYFALALQMAFFNFLLLPYIDAAIKSPRHLILATLKRNVYYIGKVFIEKRNGQRLYDVLPYISGLDKLMVQCPFRGAAIQFVRHSRANSSYEVNSTAICTLHQKAAGY